VLNLRGTDYRLWVYWFRFVIFFLLTIADVLLFPCVIAPKSVDVTVIGRRCLKGGLMLFWISLAILRSGYTCSSGISFQKIYCSRLLVESRLRAWLLNVTVFCLTFSMKSRAFLDRLDSFCLYCDVLVVLRWSRLFSEKWSISSLLWL